MSAYTDDRVFSIDLVGAVSILDVHRKSGINELV